MLNVLKKSVTHLALIFSVAMIFMTVNSAHAGSACERDNRKAGAVAGAVVGAVVGKNTGDGDFGNKLAGAVIGSIVGSNLAGKMDCDDEDNYDSYMHERLGRGFSDHEDRWEGRRSNGRMRFNSQGYVGNTYCREFTSIIINHRGIEVRDSGYYCQTSRGWRRYDLTAREMRDYRRGDYRNDHRHNQGGHRRHNNYEYRRVVVPGVMCRPGFWLVEGRRGELFCVNNYGARIPIAPPQSHNRGRRY